MVALFGTDHLGRDIFSRTLIATRISCSIGLVSICISLLLGLVIGAISGLFGGIADLLIQKVIEVLAFNFAGDGLRDAADPYSRT